MELNFLKNAMKLMVTLSYKEINKKYLAFGTRAI
jgi:hypothetical protein